MTRAALEAGTAFHAHLDVCEQCREHPFGMCAVGNRLLREAGDVIMGKPKPKPQPRKPRRKKSKRGSQRRKRR